MDSLFSKNFILLVLSVFFVACAFMVLMPILPLFATHVVNLPERSVGLIIGASSISAFIARPFIGYLLDTYSRKIIFVVAMGMFTCAVVSYDFVAVLMLLMLVRGLHGLGWAFVTTSASTIIVDIIPAKRRAEGVGLFSLAMPVAMIVGPALGLEIYTRTDNFSVVFALCSALGIAAFILSCQLKLERFNYGKEKFSFSLSKLYEKRAVGTSLMQFCYSFSYNGVSTFLPLYAFKNGIENVSYFFVMYALGVFISRIMVRKTFDLRGPTILIVGGYTLFAIGTLWLAFITSATTLYLVGLLAGFGGGMVMPAINTMTMNIVPANARGKANATVMTAMDIGIAAGAIVLGYVAEVFSYSVMYMLVAFMLMVPVAWYFLYERKHYLISMERLRNALN